MGSGTLLHLTSIGTVDNDAGFYSAVPNVQTVGRKFQKTISMFDSYILTADPKEHLRRAKVMLDKKDNSLLLYIAVELRLCIERIIHNQLTISESHSLKGKKKNDPKRKKLAMNAIDPDSDNDYDIYYTDPENGNRIHWGEYKNIPEEKVKSIEGRLGNYLHMKLGLNLGLANDPWYADTRKFLLETFEYLSERTVDNKYYFSFKDLENFELVKK